jgi:transcription elongation factor GreB
MPNRYTTPAGHQRLQRRLEDAQSRYDQVIADNPEAAEAGDNCVWHDNFAYEENQRQMHQWARRVRDLRALVATVEIVSPPKAPNAVTVGTCVTVEVEDGDDVQVRRFVVAGFDDGDPAAGRVSYTAPLARALLGASEGENRVLHLDGRERVVAVLSIEALEEE